MSEIMQIIMPKFKILLFQAQTQVTTVHTNMFIISSTAKEMDLSIELMTGKEKEHLKQF